MAVAALLLAAPLLAQGDGGPGEVDALARRLDERIPALMDRYAIPGVIVGVVREGRTAWTRAYGLADGASGRAMTTDTRCRVESISKSVTAWGVMALMERGRIQLDSPVVQYLERWRLPDSPYRESAVTPRLLLTHTAGLPLGTVGVHYPPEAPRPSLMETLTRDAKLVREPGSGYAYSNAGYNVLEQLVEEVTGLDFGAYMEAEVLRPLGMETASFDWSADWSPPVPDGHDGAGRPIPPYVYPDRASGGLFATVHDMAAFVSAGMPGYPGPGTRVLGAGSIALLHRPAVALDPFYGLAFDGYGFGHFVERLPSGHTAVAHGGQGSGWMTHFHAVPETGDAIILLTNSQRAWPFFARILGEWADWAGHGGVGMEVLVPASRILWAVSLLLLLGSGGLVVRLGADLVAGRRRFGLLRGFTLRRGILLATAAGIIGALAWALAQPYLVTTSLFPLAAPWLARGLALGAVALVLSATTVPRPTGPAAPAPAGPRDPAGRLAAPPRPAEGAVATPGG